MTNPPQSPEAKSIAYATSLGLNSVYETATEARKLAADKHLDLNQLRSRRRNLEAFKHDREMEVAEQVYEKHASESQAARDRILKVEYSNDADIREARDELASIAGEIDSVESDIELLSQDIKIAVARLNELGGYFQFMAVIKEASEARKAKDRQGPWV